MCARRHEGRQLGVEGIVIMPNHAEPRRISQWARGASLAKMVNKIP